jgi:hypothetical protein
MTRNQETTANRYKEIPDYGSDPSSEGREPPERGTVLFWVMGLLLLLTFLSGCAPSMTTERWFFQKPGMTDAQRKQDQRECLSDSIDPVGPIRMGEFIHLDRQSYEECMKRRGYALRIER